MYSLKIGDEEFEIGAETIASIADSLADTAANTPIFEKLVDHPSANVRRPIAYKDKISEETFNKLADDTDIYVMRTLVNNSYFRENASTEQVLRMLNIGDSEICRDVSNYIEGYGAADQGEIVKFLLAHPDPSVRLVLAGNYGTPKNVVKKLLSDPDMDVRAKAESR